MKQSKQLKKGKKVKVISGAHKGAEGAILQVLKSSDRVLVEGVNMRKRHEKGSQNNPDGGIVEREGSIHLSNVQVID